MRNEKLVSCKGKHERPVHLNRGRHGNVWLCIACGKQMSGPSMELSESDFAVLIEFLKIVTERNNRPKRAEQGVSEMEGVQVTFNFREGVTPTEIATKLRFHAGLLEGMPPKSASSRKNTGAEVEETETNDEADFAASTEEAQTSSSFDDEAAEVEEPPKKTTKAKAPTKEDVNAACKLHAKKHGFDTTKALLTKKFKTVSVSTLKPDQYAAVIATMKV